MNFFWVGAGGALGALLRYGLGVLGTSVPAPWGVFVINLVGSFSLGILLGNQARYGVSPGMMYFLATGLLGAFTTFSTFSWDNWQLFEQGQYHWLALNILGQVLLGMLGVGLGRSLVVG